MMRCGLLGEKLGHSYSPAIHAQLADYAYGLYEVAPEELSAFLTGGDFDALNVTIPYKKAVIPYCTELSPIARRLGSVNVLVRRVDGTLYGDNADAFGFEYLVRRSGIDVAGQKALVLGNGGASATIQAVLEQLGAHVTVISRHGPDNYDNLDRHADAHVIVNTTPVGMYPNTGKAAVDLRQFPQCAGVLDIVYNPARTALLLQAESLGIPCAGGLYMLVGQAVAAVEIFLDQKLPADALDKVFREVKASKENIVLTGMPGSGKSTVGQLLAAELGREFYDTDALIVERTGKPISEIFATRGELAFRKLEQDVVAELSQKTGCVIATGGGAVLRAQNIQHLRANGRIYFLDRPVDDIVPTDDRPLALDRAALEKRYKERYLIYCSTADAIIPVQGLPETVAKSIRKEFST